MSDELAAVRDFNFDWVRGLPEVWTDYWDDESLNRLLRAPTSQCRGAADLHGKVSASH